MIKNIKLLAIFIFAILARLFTSKTKRPIKKIVIIQMAKMGDMVCTTPLFKAVKEKYPECELIVVGNKVNGELLENDIYIDKYIVFDGIRNVVNKLKSERIDYGATAGPGFVNLAVLFLSFIPQISTPRITNGISPYEDIWYKALRLFCVTVDHKMRHYTPREYLRLLLPINISSDDTRKNLFFSEIAEKNIESDLSNMKIMKGDFFVCIAPGAGNKIKQWPSRNFSEVAEYIRDKYGKKILVIGSGKDKNEVDELFLNLKNKENVFNLSSKLNLDELKALISMAGLFISVDTGPIYIAEAFNVSTINIIGPVDENEQSPKGEGHITIVPKRERAEIFVMDTVNYDESECIKQSESIKIEEVKEAIDSIFSNTK